MRKDTSTSVHGQLRASVGNGVRRRNQAARLADIRVCTYSAEGRPTVLGPTYIWAPYSFTNAFEYLKQTNCYVSQCHLTKTHAVMIPLLLCWKYYNSVHSCVAD